MAMGMNRWSGCEHRSTRVSSVVTTWGGRPLELAAARSRLGGRKREGSGQQRFGNCRGNAADDFPCYSGRLIRSAGLIDTLIPAADVVLLPEGSLAR